MVLEVNSIHAINNFGSLEDEINILAGVCALLGLRSGWLLDISSPGNILEGMLLEEVAAPLSKLVQSFTFL